MGERNFTEKLLIFAWFFFCYDIKGADCFTHCDTPVDSFKLETESMLQVLQTPYQCKGCGVCFAEMKSFTTHVRSSHPLEKPPVTCAACGKDVPFKSKHNLNNHLQTHFDTRNHACPYSPQKRFRTSQHLSNHMEAKHDEGKVYPCPALGCGKTFKSSQYLRKHRVTCSHTASETSACKILVALANRSNQQEDSVQAVHEETE